MTNLEPTASNGRHIITASSREHREQLITEFFNRFDVVEKSRDVVVLKRRAVTFIEQRYQERSAFDRSWKGWLLFLLFLGMPTAATAKEPKPDPREAIALAALPAGTDEIEIQLSHRRD